MKQINKIFDLIKTTYSEWKEDNVSRLAAALAYYTIFSLAPLLIIAVTVAGFVWSRYEVESQVLLQIQGLLGKNGADFVQTLMQNASVNLDKGIFTTVVGVGALIFGSIGVFRQLRYALNTMWGIEVEKVGGFWKSIKSVLVDNILNFAMVMGVGFILLVSLIVSTGITAVNRLVTEYLLLSGFLVGLINTFFSLAVITLVFALLFKYLPETDVAWGDVFLGGFVTAVLFGIGKYAIGIYLGNSSVGVTFGAAGSLALLLIWFYYSAQIFFFGAEFTQVYANRYGSKIRSAPQDTGEPIKTKIPVNRRVESPVMVERTLLVNDLIPKSDRRSRQTYFLPTNLSTTPYGHPSTQISSFKGVFTFFGILVASLVSTLLVKIIAFPDVDSNQRVD
jgi:membrane protein